MSHASLSPPLTVDNPREIEREREAVVVKSARMTGPPKGEGIVNINTASMTAHGTPSHTGSDFAVVFLKVP